MIKKNLSIKNEVLDFFMQKKIVTLRQLSEVLNCSIRTSQRRLKQWSAYKSYNKNGQYYVLPEIVQFDQNGLWKYKKAFFSKFGNLRQTVVSLVQRSSYGLSGTELGKLLGLLPRSFLSHFKNDPSLYREKVDGIFVYFHHEPELRKEQFSMRMRQKEMAIKETKLPEPQLIIAVLVELIKHPKVKPRQLIRGLIKKGCPITLQEMKNIFRHYELPKKKTGNSDYSI
jgi:hypothetical protein